MGFDEFGCLQPTLSEEGKEAGGSIDVLSVCPFSQRAGSEDQLAEPVFGKAGQHDPYVGYFISNYVGFVREPGYREHGSSGGVATWILNELLLRDIVDAVVHVAPRTPSDKDRRLAAFTISDSPDRVRQGAKTRYYPVEMSEVLRYIRQHPKRYAIIGLPCFIKAIRLLMRDPIISSRVLHCISLVCGHQKSAEFAELFAWQCGIWPGQIESIDFRKKLSDRPAWDYGVEVIGRNRHEENIRKTAVASELFGTNWGYGFFKYRACDCCDDVVGETADLSVGDAWLPEYSANPAGTNIMTVRHPVLDGLLRDAARHKRLALETVGPTKVAESQSAGFRHRREGLAFRLHLVERSGRWHPPKRVKSCSYTHDLRFRRIHEFRTRLAEKSHTAWSQAREQQDFALFVDAMQPLMDCHDACYGSTLSVRWRVPSWLCILGSRLGIRLRRLTTTVGAPEHA
jgi:coenzyme F420-reducing hydrogenase beta subunit